MNKAKFKDLEDKLEALRSGINIFTIEMGDQMGELTEAINKTEELLFKRIGVIYSEVEEFSRDFDNYTLIDSRLDR